MPIAHILDTDALHRLGEQLGSSEVLCGFLHRYLALLDQRVTRLEHALLCSDQDDWMDAALSLKASSVMAGAQALAEQAAELEQESACCASWHAPVGPVGSRPLTTETAAGGLVLTRRAERMACLRRLAAETAHQLRVFLRQVDGASRSATDAPRTG